MEFVRQAQHIERKQELKVNDWKKETRIFNKKKSIYEMIRQLKINKQYIISEEEEEHRHNTQSIDRR